MFTNGRNDDGATGLVVAAGLGRLDAVKVLVAGGADIGSATNDGALRRARRALDAGAGATPLHVAAARGNLEVCRFLLQSGARPNSCALFCVAGA